MDIINKNTLKPFVKKYGITSLGVFGSRARGTAKPTSDIDLLVEFSSPKSLFELVRIERELSEALKIKVDLLTRRSLSPYLKDRILKEVRQVI